MSVENGQSAGQGAGLNNGQREYEPPFCLPLHSLAPNKIEVVANELGVDLSSVLPEIAKIQSCLKRQEKALDRAKAGSKREKILQARIGQNQQKLAELLKPVKASFFGKEVKKPQKGAVHPDLDTLFYQRMVKGNEELVDREGEEESRFELLSQAFKWVHGLLKRIPNRLRRVPPYVGIGALGLGIVFTLEGCVSPTQPVDSNPPPPPPSIVGTPTEQKKEVELTPTKPIGEEKSRRGIEVVTYPSEYIKLISPDLSQTVRENLGPIEKLAYVKATEGETKKSADFYFLYLNDKDKGGWVVFKDPQGNPIVKSYDVGILGDEKRGEANEVGWVIFDEKGRQYPFIIYHFKNSFSFKGDLYKEINRKFKNGELEYVEFVNPYTGENVRLTPPAEPGEKERWLSFLTDFISPSKAEAAGLRATETTGTTATAEATATPTATPEPAKTLTPEPTATEIPSEPKEIKAKMAKSKITIYNVPQSKKKHGKGGFDRNYNRSLVPDFTVLRKYDGWYFVEYTSFDRSTGMGGVYGTGWVRASDLKLENGQDTDIPLIWWADPDPEVQEQGFENWVKTVPIEGFTPQEEKQIREGLRLLKYVKMPPSWKPNGFKDPFSLKNIYELTEGIRRIRKSNTGQIMYDPNGNEVMLDMSFFGASPHAKKYVNAAGIFKEGYNNLWVSFAPKEAGGGTGSYSDLMSHIMLVSALKDLLEARENGQLLIKNPSSIRDEVQGYINGYIRSINSWCPPPRFCRPLD